MIFFMTNFHCNLHNYNNLQSEYSKGMKRRRRSRNVEENQRIQAVLLSSKSDTPIYSIQVILITQRKYSSCVTRSLPQKYDYVPTVRHQSYLCSKPHYYLYENEMGFYTYSRADCLIANLPCSLCLVRRTVIFEIQPWDTALLPSFIHITVFI